MANTTKINNRYKVRISESPIFWTTNSINHPSKKLWEITYLPTFVDIDCYVNWIDVYSLTSILDKNTYTMLELTDTVTNEIMYFLANDILKKLSNGYEIRFTCDVYLTFGLGFYQWLADNNLPIQVNRFLNNNILKIWMDQRKYNLQDNLLDFKKGNVRVYDLNDPIVASIQGLHGSNFEKGTITNNKTAVGIKFLIGGGGSNQWLAPLFAVFEHTNGTYYAFLLYASSNFNVQVIQNATGQYYSRKTFYCNYSDLMNWINNTATYWIDKMVGIFAIPCWKYINNWFFVDDDSCPFFGFYFSNAGTAVVGDSYVDTNVSNNNIVNPQIPQWIVKACNLDTSLMWNMFTDLPDITSSSFTKWTNNSQKLSYNLQPNNDNIAYINPYFFSQIRFRNNTIQMCPINGYDNFYSGTNLEFDGNQFNLIKNMKNTSNLIIEYYPTINCSIDSYAEYVAATKPQFNTNLQIMKSNNDLASTRNTMDAVFNGLSNFFGMMGNIASFNFGGAINNLFSLGQGIGDSVLNQQQLDLNYQNLQKQQDAQLASAKISSTAQNIHATNTQDDVEQKALILSDSIEDMYTESNTWNATFLGKFITSFYDLKFINNLIWKNGLVGDLFIPATNCFSDDTIDENGNKVNSFIYLDFVCDDDFIRFYAPNMPVAYVDALKVVTSNSLRIWDVVPDVNNFPDYYVAFAEVAYDLKNS